MTQPFFLVDAFAERPFTGNPAGVCLLSSDADPQWLQAVGNEINQAETAFVRRRADGDWDLRWFTPTCEVDLCGHATLASAHVLWSTNRVATEQAIRFHTRSGVLSCRRRGEQIEMDFPSEPAQLADVDTSGLGLMPTFVGRNRMDVLIALGSAAEVRSYVPDFVAIARLEARGLIITASGDVPGVDFISRFFAPQSGVAEDPVTGSAHCCLGPFWQKQLNKEVLVGIQASKRGGRVQVRCAGARVYLAGSAVLVLEGQLTGR